MPKRTPGGKTRRGGFIGLVGCEAGRGSALEKQKNPTRGQRTGMLTLHYRARAVADTYIRMCIYMCAVVCIICVQGFSYICMSDHDVV